jgi:two-component system, chemotaxis family, chemotaxis protein CheY
VRPIRTVGIPRCCNFQPAVAERYGHVDNRCGKFLLWLVNGLGGSRSARRGLFTHGMGAFDRMPRRGGDTLTEAPAVPIVLVVDDSAIVRRQVINALSKTGLHVLEASDGQEALILLEANSIRLLITDINMPRMSGVELLIALSDKGIKVPTIVLTSEVQVTALREARAAGALAWITKPFDPELLATSVLRALSRASMRSGGSP